MRALVGLLITSVALQAEVGLTAPASTPAGGPFEATWTADRSKGRIDVVNSDGSKLPGGAYGYASSKKKVKLTAPAAAGEYALQFANGAEILQRVPITVTPVTATLDAPATAAMNESFMVTWTGPAYSSDRIRIGNAEGKPITGASAIYPATAQGKPITLVAPVVPGSYTVLYDMKGTILEERPLEVTGSTASVTSAPTVQAGAELTAYWKGPDNKGDYVAIVPVGAKSRPQNASFKYTGLSTAGGVTLLAPETVGKYEVVYFTGGTALARQPVEVVPVSATLEAANEVVGTLTFPVTWTGPGNEQDRIIIRKPGIADDPNAKGFGHSYLDPAESVATLLAPETPGDYELHYLTRAGKVLATRPLKVLPPPRDPGSLQVLGDFSKGFGEGTSVEVILDASGSMLQRQGDKRRITIAKETLTALLGETIPAGTPFALRVFGHKEPGSCRTDLEIPLQPLDPAAVQKTIAGINAMNLAKTPIAASLEKVPGDLKGTTGEHLVILLTDGEETCGGDPALAIKSLRSQGLDVRINIIGYAIDDAALQDTFHAWAMLGGGQYLNAPSAKELTAAVRQALALPFEVRQEGKAVADGLSNGPSLSLPAGDYEVHYRFGGKELNLPATVVSKELTRVTIP